MSKFFKYGNQIYTVKEKSMNCIVPFGVVADIGGINNIYLNASMDLSERQKIFHKLLKGFRNNQRKKHNYNSTGVRMEAIRKSKSKYIVWECE